MYIGLQATPPHGTSSLRDSVVPSHVDDSLEEKLDGKHVDTDDAPSIEPHERY